MGRRFRLCFTQAMPRVYSVADHERLTAAPALVHRPVHYRSLQGIWEMPP